MRNNVIIIGKFNLSDYNNFSAYSRNGRLYFFHASTTWFIKDKRILKYLLRPGDFIEQEALYEIEENSMEFIRGLEDSFKSMSVEGVYLMPLLRFWNIRRHSMLLEAYITLSESLKRYKPEAVIIDATCNQSYRSKIYCAVAGSLMEKEGIPISFLDSKETESGLIRFYLLRSLIKDYARKTISLLINLFCKQDGMKKTIVFSGSFNQMAQVMKWFADSKVYNIVYFKQGIPLNKALFFIKNKIKWQKIPASVTRREGYKNTLLDGIRNNWFKSGDVIRNYFRGESFLAELMKQFTREDISQNLNTITKLIQVSSNIFHSKDVNAVFLDEDQTLQNRIIVDSANYNKKETFVISHGILGQKTNYIFSARNIFTYGKKVSQEIKDYSNCFRPDIYEIGTPRLDRLKRLKAAESKYRIQNDFLIPSDKKIILYSMGDMFFDKEHYTGRLKEETQMIIYKTAKRLSDLVKKNNGLFLIIKLKDEFNEKKFVSDTYNIGESEGIKVTGSYDIDCLVSGCDLIINTITTVSYHGLVAKKPVIRVKAMTDHELWEFTNTDAEEVIEIDSLHFEEKIMDLLYDERKRKQFHQNANKYLNDNYRNEDLRVRERLLKITNDVLN